MRTWYPTRVTWEGCDRVVGVHTWGTPGVLWVPFVSLGRQGSTGPPKFPGPSVPEDEGQNPRTYTL